MKPFLLFVIFRPPTVTFCYVCWINSSRILKLSKDLLTAFLTADWDEELIAAILTAAEHEAQRKRTTPHARLIILIEID